MNGERTDRTTPETVEGNDTPAKLLRDTIREFDCTSGTLHRKEGEMLELVAHEGIPESVLAKIETIPIGKGMAGLAAERMEPVQVCNLQTDDSGVAEAGARDTGLEGSIAVPLLGEDETLQGSLGIAKPESYEFERSERTKLTNTADQIAKLL